MLIVTVGWLMSESPKNIRLSKMASTTSIDKALPLEWWWMSPNPVWSVGGICTCTRICICICIGGHGLDWLNPTSSWRLRTMAGDPVGSGLGPLNASGDARTPVD